VSRRILSLTGELLEKLPDRQRSIRMFRGEELLEPTKEIRRKVVECFEDRLEDLLCARPVHYPSSIENKRRNAQEEYEESSIPVNSDNDFDVGMRGEVLQDARRYGDG
jgi:hypothetical protein